MILPFLLMQAAASPLASPLPMPLSKQDVADIGCVAAIGLLAYEQRQGKADAEYPDVKIDGRIWAGIVGDRIAGSTGQPPEVIALAIRQAVAAEQQQTQKSGDPAAFVKTRMAVCLPQMAAQVMADKAVSAAPELP
jgi:hypothetical protein